MRNSDVIALLALVVTAFAIANSWLILPEQVRGIRENAEKMEGRIYNIEKGLSERAESLARIEELLKRIDERIPR